MKNKRLGKGLSALIPQQDEQYADQKLIEVEVARVKPNPYQPRLKFDHQALEELKDSIREKGLIQPVTVRRANSHFELIAGERRLRAVIEVGLEKIPAYIIDVDTKEEMLELALVENVQRERLNPIEQANAFQRLINECHLTQDEVAQKIGKDRTTIANIMRLLKLPDYIKTSLEEADITIGHARALVSVEDTRIQKILWQKVIQNGISVRRLEKLIKDLAHLPRKKLNKKVKKSPYIQKIEEQLRDVFGTKVAVRSRKEGGSIEIEFYSPEDLNRLLEIFEQLH
jgi:ParB family chromosome partitioning protein